MMPTMLEYVVKNFYPEIYEAISAPEQEDEVNQRYWVMFEEVVSRTAQTAALW
jgi:uncharacterized protein YdiU (UPF0061 family)